MCEPEQTSKRFDPSQELMCIIVHPSLTHYSFTYLHPDTHIHTHTEHVHECWYGLIRALNTRLDAGETHLSPCNCVETMLSASVSVCVCSCECDPPGFGSKQSSVEWLAPNLIDRQATSSSLSSPRSRLVYHPFLFCLIIPPSWIPLILPPFFLPVSPFELPTPFFNVMFVLFFAAVYPSSILSHSCNINTSLCLCRDLITCGKTTHNRRTSAIWRYLCVCVHKVLYINVQKHGVRCQSE